MAGTAYTEKEWVFIYERIDKQLHALTTWERGFFDSVMEQVKKGKPMTAKQQVVLSRIWDNL